MDIRVLGFIYWVLGIGYSAVQGYIKHNTRTEMLSTIKLEHLLSVRRKDPAFIDASV